MTRTATDRELTTAEGSRHVQCDGDFFGEPGEDVGDDLHTHRLRAGCCDAEALDACDD